MEVLNKENKKPTNAQLQRRIERAVLHIDRTRNTKEVYFADRGIRISVTEDTAVLSQFSYTLCFDKIVASGYSRIYILLSSLVDISMKHDCTEKSKEGDYKSFSKLVDTSKEGENGETDYGIVVIFTLWLSLLQSPMFLSPENPKDLFTLNTLFATNSLVHGVVSKTYEKDMTNKDLLNELRNDFDEYVKDVKNEFVAYIHETKEDREKAIAEAMGMDSADEQVKKDIENSNL